MHRKKYNHCVATDNPAWVCEYVLLHASDFPTWSQDFGLQSAPATDAESTMGGACRQISGANYKISFPLQLLSTVSLFYSMREFASQFGGERSVVVIRALL